MRAFIICSIDYVSMERLAFSPQASLCQLHSSSGSSNAPSSLCLTPHFVFVPKPLTMGKKLYSPIHPHVSPFPNHHILSAYDPLCHNNSKSWQVFHNERKSLMFSLASLSESWLFLEVSSHQHRPLLSLPFQTCFRPLHIKS